MRRFWTEFSAALEDTSELRITQVLDALDEAMGPHIFPPRADGSDPRSCPSCQAGKLSLRLGKFGSFIGCSNYPECKYTRQLGANGDGDAATADGQANGPRVLGKDPTTGFYVTLRDGRFGPYVQLGEGEKPKRQSLPKGTDKSQVDFEMAQLLLSLPREVARHPESGEPILASIGRFGPYVQHGKVYANLGSGDDVLTIGANRAIDLIIAKESGKGGRRFGAAAAPGKVLGAHPEGGDITLKDGRYGPYVTYHGVNATIPKDKDPTQLTLAEAVDLIAARQAQGGGKTTKKASTRAAPKTKKAATKKAAAAKTATTKKPATDTASKAKAKTVSSKASASKTAAAKTSKEKTASSKSAPAKAATSKATTSKNTTSKNTAAKKASTSKARSTR